MAGRNPAKRCGCGQEDRIPGQGYGYACKAQAQRRYRARRAKERKKLIKAGVVPARYPYVTQKRASR